MSRFPIRRFILFWACCLTMTACANRAIKLPVVTTVSTTLTPFVLPTSQATSTHPQPREIVDERVYSPNGLLVAKKYGEVSSINYDRIEIQDSKGSVLWSIPFEGVILGEDGKVWIEIPEQGEEWKGEPNPSIYVFEWSRDSQYLYFNYRLFSDGYQPLMDKHDLQRINVNTGIIEKVLPGTGAMDFSFSPNQEYLIYTRLQDMPRRIIIRNISEGTEQSISHPEWNNKKQIGGFDWSPHSNHELRFYTFEEEWIQVFYLSIKELSTKLVFEFWIEEYWNDVWLPNNILRYKTLPENDITEIDIAMPTPRAIGTATIAPAP